MRTYLFRTRVTMKAYNYTKWYILPDIVNDFETDAETLAEALKKYREHVQKTAYIDISKTALKRKREMFVDRKDGTTRQVGYVITGKTEFEDRDRGRWVEQYIDLWVEVVKVECIDFDAA